MGKKFSRLIYIFFYVLISEDLWRIAGGFVITFIFSPGVCQSKEALGRAGEIIIWIMIMTLGWSISAWPASKISKGLSITIKKLHKKAL